MSVINLIYIEINQLQQTVNLLILPDQRRYMFNKTQNMNHEKFCYCSTFDLERWS